MESLSSLAASSYGHDLGRAAVGGVLIGLAAGLLMVANGRVAGISGLFAGLLGNRSGAGSESRLEDALFLAGLPLGALLFKGLGGQLHLVLTSAPWVLVAGGVLVGFGTRLGGGCTSGHGVCGLARLSRRSLVATAIFMAAAVATVAGGRLL